MLPNFTGSVNPLNCQRTISKESRDNTVHRFLSNWVNIQREDGANTKSIWSPQRNCYHNNDVILMVHSPNDDDIDFFDIVAGVLPRDALVPCLFMICFDYIRQTSIQEKNLTQMISHRNWQIQTMQMISYFSQVHLTKPNSYCIVWNK